MTTLTEQHIKTIKDAAKKLTGGKRRAFQAQVATDYMNSKPYLAEKTFGWDRKTVALGLNELRTGLVCFDNFKARGNKKTEVKMPQLEIDIVAFVWRQLSCPVRRQLSWPVLVKKMGYFFKLCFFSITVSFYFNNCGMVNNAINSRNGHHGVWKDLIPVTERLIRGDD